jgi:hypothetical protein
MKTRVRIMSDVHQEAARTGDEGYVDGYVNGADGRPYAVVAIRDFLSLVPLHQLKVLETFV